jgi:Ras-related protein Rab-1A
LSAGQERYNTITTAYYRGADAILLVFDMCSQESFSHLKNWLEEVVRYCPEGTLKVVVANKCDKAINRVVSKAAAKVRFFFGETIGLDYSG